MPIHDFRCAQGHVTESLVKIGVKEIQCPECGKAAELKFLTPPKLDWQGIGAQANASPEFISRFEKAHKERRKQEEAYTKDFYYTK